MAATDIDTTKSTSSSSSSSTDPNPDNVADIDPMIAQARAREAAIKYKDFEGPDIWGCYKQRPGKRPADSVAVEAPSKPQRVDETDAKLDDDFIISVDGVMVDGPSLVSIVDANVLPLVPKAQLTGDNANGGAAAGYKKLQELMDCLSTFNPRDELQIQAQKKFICCALRHIFGTSFDSQRERLAREFQLKRIKNGTIVYMPRRHGKTWAVAQYAAAYARVMTKYDAFVIELIAHGLKQTNMLMGTIKDNLATLRTKYNDFLFGKNNAAELWLVRCNHVCKIRCWTDSESHTLGMGGNGLALLDEAVRMSKTFFLKNVNPTMQMANSSIAIISSPGDQDNWVTQLMNVKDDNDEPLLDVLQQVEICEACSQLPFDKRVDCPHIRPPPFWLSKEKQGVNKAIAKAMNNLGTYLVEQRGMVGSYCECPTFNEILIKNELAVPFTSYLRFSAPPVLYIAVDPGAGKSRTAVISAYRDKDKTVLVSIDAVKSEDIPEMRAYFRALNERLRRISFLASIPFVVIVEQDLANGVAIVKDVTAGQQIRGFYFFHEDPDSEKQAGVAKRGKSNAYPTRTTKALTEKTLAFDPNLFTITLTCAEEHHTRTDADSKLANPDANNAIDYLKFEMYRFGYDEKKHMHHGKWNGQNDDTAVTLQMLLYWMQEIYKPFSPYEPQVNRFIDSYRPNKDKL